jgi:diguanylate cyclase (GGDEF)-like protein/PAS domain S-box-containing protein
MAALSVSTTQKILLIVEDNLGDVRLVREMINDGGAHNTRLIHVDGIRAAEAYVAAHAVDIILLDLGLSDAQGLEAVGRAHSAAPRVPLVVLTGMDDEGLAGQALKLGAQDYLIKGQIEARGLARALRYAVERKSMEEALFIEKERAEVTLNCIADAVACSDRFGNISFINRFAQTMTGWSMVEAFGRPMSEVLRIEDARTHEAVLHPMERALAPNNAQSPVDWVLVRRDGFQTPIEDSVATINDRDGQTIGAVIVFRDVRAARAMAAEMIHSAKHDFLTGLPNRMLLTDRVNQAIGAAPRHRKKVAVLFLDLDGFKHVNDSLGHPVGDKLLQSVGQCLVGCVRSADTVSRQGGDEFVVLLSEVEHSEDAAISARRILAAVAEGHAINGRDLHITTSIGISVYPDDGLDAESLIKNADIAMYQAKENGPQTYRFFKPEMNVRAVERQETEENLRLALDRHEFELHYQAKVDLRSGELAGAEALIRWRHPTRGLLSPDQFIPVAEDSGLILPIGNWVLRQACAQTKAWRDHKLALPQIAVNISALEFRGENFLDGVFAILEETQLDPSRLELELTESVLMRQTEATASTLRVLKARGVTLTIDDFGTGYSSLSYLTKFPIDALKIDQSFIRQISTAGENTSMVAAMLNMARSLRLTVIAEGVENDQELEFLKAHDCDYAQGYLFSRPLPAADFARLFQTEGPTLTGFVNTKWGGQGANGESLGSMSG